VLGCSDAVGDGGAVPCSFDAVVSAFIRSRSFLLGGLSPPTTGKGFP
jgi:hypothetical protein